MRVKLILTTMLVDRWDEYPEDNQRFLKPLGHHLP
jgi:hypothetical protein